MSRIAPLCAAALLSAALLTGCDGTGDTTPETTAPPAAPASTTPLEGYEAMPADGAGETAAAGTAVRELEALSDISAEQLEVLKADQRLIAYLVRAELDGQVALFEVRAEGLAHNIYSYPRAFDSGSIIWTPAENAQSASGEARSAGEQRSVAAVDEAMRDSFPDGGYTVALEGYRFAFIAEGLDPVHVEIGADGATLISVSR